ncbi:MAG: 6-bladed beta-propeller [Nitrospirae bacterium]|nr:6-bladed beta-propeller [Nitrospirota bacterium]
MNKKYLIFFIILFLFAGCATSEVAIQDSELDIRGPNPVWPPPPQTARVQYIRSISGQSDIKKKKSWFIKTMDSILGKGQTSGNLLRPYGVFADADKIYVTDPGTHFLHIFDIKEKRYLEIRNADRKDLISPIGVAVDKNGEIYLSDSILKRVFHFDKDGKYIREIGSDDLFIRPAGIAIDEERLYVIDTHKHNVLVFSKKDGSLLFNFGKKGNGKGEFNYPTNIFIAKDNLLYISDSMNFRVQIFDKNGKFISTFGKHGDGSGDFSKSKGIAVDSDGHIYVADAHFDTVQIFDKDGRLLLAFGNTGRKKGQMILPAGLFIDEQDRIYVADSNNNRIQIFQYLKK